MDEKGGVVLFPRLFVSGPYLGRATNDNAYRVFSSRKVRDGTKGHFLHRGSLAPNVLLSFFRGLRVLPRLLLVSRVTKDLRLVGLR